jgi:uncharacterized membrane protein
LEFYTMGNLKGLAILVGVVGFFFVVLWNAMGA